VVLIIYDDLSPNPFPLRKGEYCKEGAKIPSFFYLPPLQRRGGPGGEALLAYSFDQLSNKTVYYPLITTTTRGRYG
jgi:hypothetical protein